MKKIIVGLVIPLFAQAIYAGFNANVALKSNYILHGITQTDQNPAIQGGFAYNADMGLYVGTWASNVSFLGGKNSIENDLYAGYKSNLAKDWSMDLRDMQIMYPNSTQNSDFNVAFAALTYRFFTLREGYAPDVLNNSTDAVYSQLEATYPLSFSTMYLQNISLLGSLERVNYGNVVKARLNNYWDWSAGVSKGFLKHYSASVVYTDNDLPARFHPSDKSAIVAALSCNIG